MNALLRAAAVAGCCAIVYTGCADLRWTKPGADAAAISRDLDACRASALRRASPQGMLSTDPQVPVDRAGAPPTASPAAPSNERFIAEHEDIRLCMIQRGYQLQPAR